MGESALESHYFKQIRIDMQNPDGQEKKDLALLQIPINPDVANKIENLKMLQTQVF